MKLCKVERDSKLFLKVDSVFEKDESHAEGF